MRLATSLALAAAAIVVWAALHGGSAQPALSAREDAYRANNVGVARLEQADFAAATAAFRRALEIDASLAIARINLGIALFNAGDRDGARRELESVREKAADRPQVHYMLGMIARVADRPDEAADAFRRVLAIDPADPGANVNLGQVFLQQQKYAEAAEVFRAAAKAEPFNATAAYGLATALVRSGAPEGRPAMEHFQQLRQSSYATTFSQLYLEQGRYAEGVASTGAEPELVSDAVPAVGFVDATAAALPDTSETAGLALVDLDGDGHLDIVTGGTKGALVLRNAGGRFAPSAVGVPSTTGRSEGALPGDFDNDGQVDLLVLKAGGIALLRQAAANRFEDVTTAAAFGSLPGLPRTAAWLDADHDGDLDLFVGMALLGNGGANRLFRNNGNGTFADITTSAGLPSDRALTAVVPTDFDNRRDIDLLLVPVAGPPLLFRNARDGSFVSAAGDARLTIDESVRHAAIGDVNKDDFPDLFLSQANGPGVLALSDGRARFRTELAPGAASGATAAQFLDYDGDGLLDLFALTAQGPRVIRNLGNRWADVTSRAAAQLSSVLAGATSFASADLDGDGDTDIVVRKPSGLTLLRNDGGDGSRALRVQLQPRVSNRSSAGAKVEVRAGSLRQRLETYAATPAPAPADVRFAFGVRPGADVVRILWPSGILQAEVAPADKPGAALTGTLAVQELDRKPSSCPYLFTWNGDRFDFITDFLGGGEMGYWVAPGVRNTPDADEYVRIAGDRLRPRDGRYELRVTNELEEAVFLDRVQLVAVDHAAGVEIYPNEGLRAAPEPLRIFAAADVRPLAAAVDDRGKDVLDRLARLDRRYADAFGLERIRGYAAEHALTLTLPETPTGRRVLLLTGWTDYAFSGDNVAAHQAGLKMIPPKLQVRDAAGRWRSVIENIGFPAGRPQTVPVDLTGRIPHGAREVRIVTTMRIYWDRAVVDVSSGTADVRLTRLEPLSASLGWRGFSTERTPDGREPLEYDYARVSATSPWKVLPGRYTREGDVRELLAAADDRFVVSRPGDEIAVAFDATLLPPPRAGRTRTFLLYAVGFSKEMDLNSSSPDQLAPLPFHGMPAYPYPPDRARARDGYVDRYNTRVVKRAIPPIELIPAPAQAARKGPPYGRSLRDP